MDTKNSALAVAIAAATGGGILIIALVSLAIYRPASPEPTAAHAFGLPTPAAPNRIKTPTHRPERRPVLVQDTERIERLQKMLAEKNSLLNEKTALLNKMELEYQALEEELQQYLTLISQWTAEESETPDPAPPPAPPEATAIQEQLEAELQRVKEELSKATLMEAAMEAEVARLQTELEGANEQTANEQQAVGREIASLVAEAQAARGAAAQTLRRIGAPAVPALVELLADPRPDARRWAADMLGALGPDARDAIPSLVEALADSDEGVRSRALDALNAIRD